MKFVIGGQPSVKKNNQRVSFRGKYPVKYNTPSYTRWQADARPQIQIQALKFRDQLPITTPINLQCLFFMGTARRVDLSALYEGIQDELVKMGVLEDDNYNIVSSHDGSGVRIDRQNPRMEITITPIKESEL